MKYFRLYKQYVFYILVFMSFFGILICKIHDKRRPYEETRASESDLAVFLNIRTIVQ